MRGLCAPPGRKKLLLARQLASPALKSDPPKQLVPVFTPLHCVWLKTLKASARNSKPVFSRISKCLNKPMSKLVRCGLFNTLRPDVPNVRPSGAANAAGLKSSGPTTPCTPGILGTAFGLPTMFRYDPAPVPFPTPALKSPSLKLKGVPVWNVVNPESCQPPSTV